MDRSSSSGDYPVDNATYNLLQSLTSKLEALDAYKTYEQDADDQSSSLFRELAEQDRQHAQRLLEAVKQKLSQS
ncbi:MAG: hypothetical protein H0X16_05240 [Chloroflexi bacterium]|nr:hypothetical protein [Chloroflexota bacterium]